jgi:hypothetical protein
LTSLSSITRAIAAPKMNGYQPIIAHGGLKNMFTFDVLF